MVQELAAGPGAVGADQELFGEQFSVLVAHRIGQLVQGLAQYPDVVRCAVGTPVRRPQFRDQDLSGAVVPAVAGARDERGVPEAAFVVAGGPFLLGVRIYEGSVEVDDQRVQPGRQGGGVPRAGGFPDPGAQALGEGGEAQGEGLGASEARITNLDTVAFEAPGPNSAGLSCRGSRSETCSPPPASITARDPMIRPGRCVTFSGRIGTGGPRAWSRSLSRPGRWWARSDRRGRSATGRSVLPGGPG